MFLTQQFIFIHAANSKFEARNTAAFLAPTFSVGLTISAAQLFTVLFYQEGLFVQASKSCTMQDVWKQKAIVFY